MVNTSNFFTIIALALWVVLGVVVMTIPYAVVFLVWLDTALIILLLRAIEDLRLIEHRYS